jgi:hypothetical protein
MKFILALLLGVSWEAICHYSMILLFVSLKRIRPKFFFEHIYELEPFELVKIIVFSGLFTYIFYNWL